MTKMIVFSILVIAISLSACQKVTPINPSPTISGGIEGRVTEGPMCPGPVPIGNNPCPDQPFQTTITIFDVNEKQIGQIQTDTEGYFKIQLLPGTYTLHPEPGKPFPIASDQIVVVNTGEYTQVSISYDTGIR